MCEREARSDRYIARNACVSNGQEAADRALPPSVCPRESLLHLKSAPKLGLASNCLKTAWPTFTDSGNTAIDKSVGAKCTTSCVGVRARRAALGCSSTFFKKQHSASQRLWPSVAESGYALTKPGTAFQSLHSNACALIATLSSPFHRLPIRFRNPLTCV